jgi:glycosyltransferase involved in cell wall biosynthesis
MQAAILFEPDGYLLDRAKLMGRQSAGNGFLRAAVAVSKGGTLSAYTPSQQSFDLFAQTVAGLDPTVRPRWIPAVRLDLLAEAGTLYRPDSAIDVSVALRLRQGLAAYSLCGVTHTLSSEMSLRHLFDLLTTPVMPWDALVCTSQAALTLVRDAMAQSADYLSWRIGQPVQPPILQLPVIPLGVHAGDFATSDTARATARQRLGIAEDEIVVLYAGRLSFSGKAHPVSMLRGLQAAHERTGRKVVLIQAGSFFNDAIARLYRDAAAKFSPDVRPLFVDGGDFAAYSASWHAADLFASLADSIQETFGLTPVEAMAAGLPVVVSDWNGYKDTVRDGVDGFRIRSWAPPAAADDMIARDHETHTGNFDMYLVRAGGAISIDQRQLNDRLSDLVGDVALRARMGAAGRARVRSDYDWSILYPRYQALWDELAAIRTAHAREPEWIARIAGAPLHHPVAPDPYALFAHYPTALIEPGTRVEAVPGASLAGFEAMARDPLFAFANPPAELVAALLGALARPCTIGEIVAASGQDLRKVTDAAARLAKMGLVVLAAPTA